ncbi:glutamine synthetase, partial [Lactobacillus sp. XV13L]|nr:glutamine synthetase [Lactobacillus sp. XV13L]
VLYPDFATWSVLPWTDVQGGKIGCLICSVHTTDGKPFDGDPRNNLKRILAQMNDMGFSAFDIGFEAEFHLLKLDQDGNWTTEVPDHASYFDLTSQDESASCRRDIVETLESIGFEVEAAHHEVGDGQQEIDFKFDDALTTADRVQLFKLVVREISKRHGLYATFMAKPLQGQAGNGMHTNMSLF